MKLSKRTKERFEVMIKRLPKEISEEDGHGSFPPALSCIGLNYRSDQLAFIEYLKEYSPETLKLKDGEGLTILDY